MDVTQLAHWQGSMTGIPRVMHELAIRIRKTDKNARFVAWVQEKQALCEIDFDKTISSRGGEVVYLHDGEDISPTDSDESIDSPAAIEKPAGEISLKQTAKATVKKALVHTSRVSPRLAEKLKQSARRARMSNFKTPGFHKGDILFIPWGEWWDSNFTNCLVSYHENYGVRLVQIIHDAGPTVQPQFFEEVDVSPMDYNSKILPIADLVLANSKYTASEIGDWLKQEGLHVPALKSFRLGDDIHIAQPARPDDPIFERSGLKGNDYILFVGTIELKKNHMLLYYVYKLAKVRGIKLPKLVIAGRRGWLTEATFALMTKDPEVKDSFVFMIGKPDDELSWLYNHCLFTVQSSLYEGWGIPIVESVARGVPCLCGDFGSMAEAAAGYTEHFTPVSTDECLAGIVRWLDPATLKAAREHVKGYQRFTWDDSFKQVETYLKELR